MTCHSKKKKDQNNLPPQKAGQFNWGLKKIFTFTASLDVVVPGYCSASVSTETTLGPVTMVTGEDVSRWELHFQNSNTLLVGMCVGIEGKEPESKGEGEVLLLLNSEWPPCCGRTVSRIPDAEPSLPDLGGDLSPSLPLAVTSFQTMAFLGKWGQRAPVTCGVGGIFKNTFERTALIYL